MDPQNPLSYLPKSTKELILNPTAKNIGETLGGVSEFILSPINIFTTCTNTYIKKFKQSIIDKINKIPENERDPSKISLAMRTIEDSKYQIDDDNLREMFAKLIAASVDKNQNQNFSPRFSNILSQLSPSDAKLLKQLSFNPSLPIPTVSYTLDVGSKIEYPVFEHLIGINYSKKDIIRNEAGLDTLTSLGIVRLRDNFEIPEESIQKFYKEMKYAEYPMQSIDRRAERDMKIVNGLIQFTTFGKNFIDTVI